MSSFSGGGRPALVLIENQVITAAVGAVDFVTGINSVYDEYLFRIHHFRPVTDATDLNLQFSVNAGTSWSTVNVTYAHENLRSDNIETVDGTGAVATNVNLTGPNGEPMGNLATEGVSGELSLYHPSDATRFPKILYRLVNVDNTGRLTQVYGSALRLAAAAVNGIRFVPSGGNVAAANISLYGVKN